jgi:trehalose 6-phosphate synthase
MRALRRQVLTYDVDRWARSFLDTLATTKSGHQPAPVGSG